MRRPWVRVASAVAVTAMLLTARQARAQQRAEDFTFFALGVAPPAALTLGFDLAMINSLSGDGTVRRGFAINGLVFSLINGLMSLVGLAAAQANPGAMRYTVSFCWAGVALTGASGALAIYSFGHPPKPVREAPAPAETGAPRSGLRPAPTVELLPSLGLTPAGSPTGGASLSLRW